MAKAIDIADYIIVKNQAIGSPVSHLRLQKLMYFLNVASLLYSAGRNALITDEAFRKWDNGPALCSIYRDYAINGTSSIEKPLYRIDLNKNGYSRRGPELSSKNKEFINKGLQYLESFTTAELIAKSYLEPQYKDKANGDLYSNEESYRFWSIPKQRLLWSK